MAEEQEKKVTLDDVVEVLAKHAPATNDPDDSDTISRFNAQVAADKEKASQPSSAQSPKGKP